MSYPFVLSTAQFHSECISWAQAGRASGICDGCWDLAESRFGREHSASTLIGWIGDAATQRYALCGHEMWNGLNDEPSYAYCGLRRGHAGAHGAWQ